MPCDQPDVSLCGLVSEQIQTLLLSLPFVRSKSGNVLVPSLNLALSIHTLTCSNADIWIIFWMAVLTMTISIPRQRPCLDALYAAPLSAAVASLDADWDGAGIGLSS